MLPHQPGQHLSITALMSYGLARSTLVRPVYVIMTKNSLQILTAKWLRRVPHSCTCARHSPLPLPTGAFTLIFYLAFVLLVRQYKHREGHFSLFSHF